MPSQYALGKRAIAMCDRCGFQFRLKQLKPLIIKTVQTQILVCPSCWEPDQPQLLLGLYPVNDPQAVRNPRTDTSYYQAGLDSDGGPSTGSRVIQWGWNPVGLSNPLALSGLDNVLQASGQIGTVSIVIE
jgi:hypothetical protein